MLLEPDKPLTDNEKEMMRFLIEKVGLKTGEARVCAALSRGYEYTYQDLEKVTSTSRSGLSAGMSGLLKRGWVERSILIRERDGHPIKVFHLIKPFNELLSEILEPVS